ncbi:hypothetical protein AK812_SmicGene31106 [Symbiodinium microadriaticum]|uniref:Uncharacterized protein n=1 Tax=Symbiodinium microadriaticum TaxID=2951 RepID=A0A1Q9CXK3_SYMMI|nr:hypothetical protein AK812_SmicGene31106 [Symbiodinium microadriaticum]
MFCHEACRRLQWALEEYPSAAEADARALSRAAKARMLQEVRDFMRPEEEEPMAGEALPMSAEPDQGPAKAETKAPAVEEINLEDNTIYSLDWDEGEAGETGKEVAIRSPRFQSSGDRAFRATPAVEDLAARQRSNLKGEVLTGLFEVMGVGNQTSVARPGRTLLLSRSWASRSRYSLTCYLAAGTLGTGTQSWLGDGDKKGEIFTPVPNLYAGRLLWEGSAALALPAAAETAVRGALEMMTAKQDIRLPIPWRELTIPGRALGRALTSARRWLVQSISLGSLPSSPSMKSDK